MTLKSNGFSRGPNCYQLATVIFIALKVLSLQYILSFLKLGIQIFFAISYPIATACLVFSAFMMTYIDPTDDILKIQRKAKLNNQPIDDLKYDMYCEVCQASVSDNAKHCCACQRCVNDFDHHCAWVNNCISKKNYKYFVSSILSLFFSVLLFGLASVVFLAGYYQEKAEIINDLKSLKDNHSAHVLIILILIFTILAGFVWILNARLILFHYYLYKNKMTTYGFITKFPERRKAKSNSITPDPLTTKTDASLTVIPDHHLLTKSQKFASNQQQVVASPKIKKEVLETNRSSSTAEDNTPKKSNEKPSFSLFYEHAKRSEKVEKKRAEKKSFFKRVKQEKKDEGAVDSSNIGSEFMSGSIFRVSPISSHNIYCEKFESDITLHNLKLQQIQKPDLSNTLFKKVFSKGESQELRLAQILHNYGPKVGEITEEDNENESVRG